MNRRSFVTGSIGAGLSALGTVVSQGEVGAVESTTPIAPKASGPRPNVVIILADDLGLGDLSCYGATKVQTPIIDKFASQGIQFSDAHAATAVCCPSRYSVLTGRYCWRTALKDDCIFGHDTLLIEEDRMTIGSMLQSAGYKTACIGKWHLGFGRDYPDWNGELKPGPLEVGFDHYFGIPVTNAQKPDVYIENHRVVNLDPKDPIRLGADSKTNKMTGGTAARYNPEELCMTETAKAVKYIETTDKSSPFFLYFTPSNVHAPFTPHPRFHGKSGCGLYGDFIMEFDWCVGEILSALDRAGVADNTLVILSSDNGAPYERVSWDRGLRANLDYLGQKTDIWEGGHRVPFIARWPGKIPANTQSNELICLIDLIASIADIIKFPLPHDAAPDSVSVLPALLGRQGGEKPVREGALILASYEGMLAVREGPWMCILGVGSGGTMTDYSRHHEGFSLEETGMTTTGWARQGCMADPKLPRGQLYNLETDHRESKNVYEDHPEIVERLTNILIEYRAHGRSRT
ncbi:MAG: arylsulfatase [Acidobacteriota bacterium]